MYNQNCHEPHQILIPIPIHCSMASKQFASGAAQNKAPTDERDAMLGFESHGFYHDRGKLKFR